MRTTGWGMRPRSRLIWFSVAGTAVRGRLHRLDARELSLELLHCQLVRAPCFLLEAHHLERLRLPLHRPRQHLLRVIEREELEVREGDVRHQARDDQVGDLDGREVLGPRRAAHATQLPPDVDLPARLEPDGEVAEVNGDDLAGGDVRGRVPRPSSIVYLPNLLTPAPAPMETRGNRTPNACLTPAREISIRWSATRRSWLLSIAVVISALSFSSAK